MAETKDILKKVRKIEIKSRGLTNQIFSGQYHSAFKGRGMAFSEVREYQYGDDIRNIDWNVTARYDHPFVKIFEEERELTVMLLIDVSASNKFGSKNTLKADVITEIAAILSFSAIQNNDKVGVIFFSDDVELFIPPKKGKKHILRIIRELIDFKPKSNKTNISEVLRYFTNVVKKRTTAFILSDFFDEDFENDLNIASRKHDISAIRIFDKRETELPNIGYVSFYDPENETYREIDTTIRSNRKIYEDLWNKKSNALSVTFAKSKVDEAIINTDADYVPPLVKMFKRKEGRM